MYSIVIPNRYEEAITPLLESIPKKIPPHPAFKPPIIIVADGHDRDYGFKMVRYDDEHFVFSRAINMGIKAAPPEADIIIMNDDTALLEYNFFERLVGMSQADERIGILSPLIVGCVGGMAQRWYDRDKFWTPDMDFIHVPEPYPVCFPCVFIRRDMLNEIGLMNEWIAGYGADDQNLCQRAREKGWKTSVTQRVVLQHGDGSSMLEEGRGASWNYSFMRRYGPQGPPDDAVQEYHKRLAGERKENLGMAGGFSIDGNPKVRYFKE